jgi:hypothetical protein
MLLLTKDKLNQILKQNRGKSYTYGLCRGSGDLFYVGVGIRQRVLNHTYEHELNRGGNKHKISIIKRK